jgi:hypothetical protein
VLEEVIKILEDNNIRDYQVIEQVTVKNKKGDHRFNNPVWPGYNSAVLMQISEQSKVDQLIRKLKEYNQQAFNDNELVTVCGWSLESYFYD